MIRPILLVFLLLLAFSPGFGQGFSSSVEVVTVYSQNEEYYLKSWPFDSEFPTLRGVTKVFRQGSTSPIYSFSCGFDSVDNESNNLTISNDGEVIFYLVSWGADEENDGLKSISIYRHGELVQSYSASAITGCDLKKERCELAYSNYNDVVDKEKSNWGSAAYKKVLKAGISDQEKFLSHYAIFTFDDIVYVTDSKRQVHQFSLKEAKHVGTTSFANIFDQIKAKGRFNKVVLAQYNVPALMAFPRLSTGMDATRALAAVLKMTPTKNYGTDADMYKTYNFKIGGFLQQNGNFELEKLELFDELPEQAIRHFFAGKKFDTRKIPAVFEKWWIDGYFYFRKTDKRVATQERKEEIKEQQASRQKRLVAETIGGRYIPRDLHDAFLALDIELSEINKKEMTALETRKRMINYHMGLGMWIRNNWGLWGGSRLQKYFRDKGVLHPDDMSSVILFFYWDWLRGNTDAWKEWEKDPKQKIF